MTKSALKTRTFPSTCRTQLRNQTVKKQHHYGIGTKLTYKKSSLKCMLKNALNSKQAITFFLSFSFVFLGFAGVVNFGSGETTIFFSTQPTGSASVIAALENSIEANGGWNSSLQTIYDGIALGQTTVNQLKSKPWIQLALPPLPLLNPCFTHTGTRQIRRCH